jgi:hypothetical protein
MRRSATAGGVINEVLWIGMGDRWEGAHDNTEAEKKIPLLWLRS